MIRQDPHIVWTRVDEAPALATYSLLPIVEAYVAAAGVALEVRDISLAGRILAQFPELLSDQQRISDDLSYLGELAKTPAANIIKLPNISASVPQLQAAISELQVQGYPLPDYPESPQTEAERDARTRYDRAKGSAVNPVLREGNSDRRAPASVKAFARKHPHSMGAWSSDSRSHVATMGRDDLRSNEVSRTLSATDAGLARIEFVAQGGEVRELRRGVKLEAEDIIDATFMSRRALRTFLANEIEDAKAKGVLFSLHLKATMMKVSDPILFGHAVEVFFADLFAKHRERFAELGVNPNDGVAAMLSKIATLPEGERAQMEGDIAAVYAAQPPMAMVNSDRGITNLHVPSDVIIDASMPAAIRAGGKMWGPDGVEHDTKFVIPDSSYAGVYRAVIEDCKRHGAYDPRTMGSVPNVGLMAQKAQEYGSHDTTFEAQGDGVIRVVAAAGHTLLERPVERGDLWRLTMVKDAAVRDWVRLAVRRARASATPAIFWLDASRGHDAELIKKVEQELAHLDTSGLELSILDPAAATEASVARIRQGLDTISVTGNVLRDYLTDLFPILEVGTSAKMLSIVPLMNGGGLFETGAGGSAPKHVQQFVAEGHLRWDSLGEFLALAASLEHLGGTFKVARANVLADALDRANARFLESNKSPSRRVHEIDNRGSHFYLALYWAEELAAQGGDPELAARFAPLAQGLARDAAQIESELLAAQGTAVDVGGYYRPNDALASAAMRPSATFNRWLKTLHG